MFHGYALGDSLSDFFQVLADQAGPCSDDVVASGVWLAGDAPWVCFWGWLGRLFQAPADQAGPYSFDVLAFGRWWAGHAPQAYFCGWFGRLFPGAS